MLRSTIPRRPTITLTVKNEFAGDDTASTYQILVQKAEPVLFTPTLQPAGALLFVILDAFGLSAMLTGILAAATVFLIRCLAAHFRWNFPKAAD